MGDLISRQAAIDAVNQYNFDFPQYMERFVTELRDAMKADLKHDIEALPSAQPEITPDGTLKVTVDADIASVGRILLSQAGTQYGGLYYKDAQPEIIRCKDCKYHRQNDYGDSWCSHPKGLDQFDLKPTDFCSRAKRRTDEPD